MDSTFYFIFFLFSVAGAMRLPCSATTAVSDMTHFLTDTYIDKFNLEIEEFLNYNENAFLKFYNEPATPVKGTCIDFDYHYNAIAL